MKGETVIVRAFGNEPLVRRIWEADSDVVYICTNENYDHLIANRDALNPIAFLRKDVFNYDDKKLLELMK